MSIRYRSDTQVSDRYLIDVDPMVFGIWVLQQIYSLLFGILLFSIRLIYICPHALAEDLRNVVFFVSICWIIHIANNPDNKDNQIDINYTSIRHFSVGSIFNRCRSERLCYLSSLAWGYCDPNSHYDEWLGNAFCITGRLWRESTAYEWIPLTVACETVSVNCCRHEQAVMSM